LKKAELKRKEAVKQQELLINSKQVSTTNVQNFIPTCPVLRIRDKHPGSEFFHPGARVKKFRILDPDPYRRISVFFSPKKLFLSSRKYDPGCSSRIPDPDLDFLPIPDLGSRVKKALDPGSATQHLS
jgi:hypothetical protein